MSKIQQALNNFRMNQQYKRNAAKQEILEKKMYEKQSLENRKKLLSSLEIAETIFNSVCNAENFDKKVLNFIETNGVSDYQK